MTVETSTRKQTFAGGQSTHTFSFRTLANYPQYIKALKTLIATGVETDLTYGVDFTVSLESDGEGGTVTVSPTVSTAYTVTVYRETDDLQSSDYDDFNQFPADTLEEDLDRRTLISQEKAEEADRTAKLPISSTVSSVTLPDPENEKFLMWSGTTGKMVNVTVQSMGTVVLDTDNTLAANSDSRVASQKAIKSYVTTQATSLINAATGSILGLNVVFDGGSSVLITGATSYIDVLIPFNCTILEATLLSNTSGSLVIDIWKDTYANFPPTVADTITASAKPTLSSAVKSQDATLTGWTTTITSGSTLRFVVDSVTSIVRATLHLKLRKTQY